MSELRFRGTERVTIEIDGSFDPAAVALPPGLEHDGGRVSLFAFHVDRLRIAGVPLIRWSYPEIVWRVAARRDGTPCWWSIACDLEARGPAWAARRYVRYQVRRSQVAVDEQRVISRGLDGELDIVVSNKIAPPLAIDRRELRVGADGGWIVPWGDDVGSSMTHPIKVHTDTLSGPTLGTPVKWSDTAVLRRGREHRCGVAHR